MAFGTIIDLRFSSIMLPHLIMAATLASGLPMVVTSDLKLRFLGGHGVDSTAISIGNGAVKNVVREGEREPVVGRGHECVKRAGCR